MTSAVSRILGPSTDPHFIYKDSAIARTLSYSVAGSSAKLFRLPRNLTDSLDIALRHLIVQVFYRSSDPVNINLYLRMATQDIFKFCFTTQERKNPTHSSKTSTQIHLGTVPRDIWVNLCFDLESVAAKYWSDSVFEALQQLEIPSSCLIRWIYASAVTLRSDLSGQDLPAGMRLTGGIESVTVNIPEQPLAVPLRNPPRSPAPKPNRPKLKLAGRPKKAQPPNDAYEDDSEPDAFEGESPSKSALHSPAVHSEEEDLELVYIEPLGCYYCPSNQQYYQMDE
jgi:hypothetical protein